MAKVAVLILNYNGEEHLQRFLPSIIKHSPDCEIIVGDNNSTDNSLSLLESTFPTIKVIKLDTNYGYAGGYNQLINQLDHDYIALVNSDIEATAGWIEPLISMLDNENSLAAVQPKILSYTNRDKFEYAGAAGGFIDKYGYPYCRGRVFDTIEEDQGQYDNTTNIFWASGACFIIKRSVFNKFGGFDADFFAHMEEIDLCWRLNNGGYQVKSCGKSTVYHLGGGTLHYGNPRKTYLNFRNGWVMLLKNIPANGIIKTLFIRWWLDLISIFFFILKFQVKDSVAILKAHGYIWLNRRKIKKKRKETLDNISDSRSIKPTNFSLVWQYFIKKKSRYTDLIPD